MFRFIDFWTAHHSGPPRHLVFNSKLTTYHGLDRLDQAGITFLTLRRRSPSLLTEVDQLPPRPGAPSRSMSPTANTAPQGLRAEGPPQGALLPPVLHHRSRP